MIRRRHLAALAPLLWLALSAHAAVATQSGDAPPSGAGLQPFEASYSWSWKGVTVAVTDLKLTHQDDDTWLYVSHSDARGIGRLYPYRPTTQSLLRVTSEGVQPLHFQVQGGGSSHDSDVTFDWAAAHASGTYDGVKVDLALKPGVQDDLSVQIALMQALLQGHPPENISVIDKNTVRDYRYSREGSETLDTPLGKIDTIIYASQHTGSPRTTRFWCAPSLGYLPLRVQQKRLDAVEWTMEIRSAKR